MHWWHNQKTNSNQWLVNRFFNLVEFHSNLIRSFFYGLPCYFIILHKVLFYCLVFMLFRLWRGHSLAKIPIWLLLISLKVKIMISINISVSSKLILIIKQVWLILLEWLKKIIKSIWAFRLKCICLKFIHWNTLSFWSLPKTKI